MLFVSSKVLCVVVHKHLRYVALILNLVCTTEHLRQQPHLQQSLRSSLLRLRHHHPRHSWQWTCLLSRCLRDWMVCPMVVQTDGPALVGLPCEP